jgi:hypothetical protein
MSIAVKNVAIIGEKNQWKNNDKPQPTQSINLDTSFSDWLYKYQPFAICK